MSNPPVYVLAPSCAENGIRIAFAARRIARYFHHLPKQKIMILALDSNRKKAKIASQLSRTSSEATRAICITLPIRQTILVAGNDITNQFLQRSKKSAVCV
jgi:hypothetical protein